MSSDRVAAQAAETGHDGALERRPLRVAYLLGAGASHACAKAANIPKGLLMRDLTEDVKTALVERLEEERDRAEVDVPESLFYLAGQINDRTDFEQLITFLDDAGSAAHRRMARHLRGAFQNELIERLAGVRSRVQRNPADLYGVLLEMHEGLQDREELLGFMTLNYDCLLEGAIEDFGCMVDRGFRIRKDDAGGERRGVRLLSLHGSFSWKHEWPVDLALGADNEPAPEALWIPPGIRKNKSQYPFNAIWGLAREMLDCDILRIVGCSLGKNDWDLVSMLFATKHAHADCSEARYVVEVIDKPKNAHEIVERFPYLNAKTLLDIDEIADVVHRDAIGAEVTVPYRELDPDQKAEVRRVATCDGNPLRYWLRRRVEAMTSEERELAPAGGLLHQFLEGF